MSHENILSENKPCDLFESEEETDHIGTISVNSSILDGDGSKMNHFTFNKQYLFLITTNSKVVLTSSNKPFDYFSLIVDDVFFDFIMTYTN